MAVSARPPQAPPAPCRSAGATSLAPVDLNEDPRRIVEHLAGGLLVLAPVGTGKTTVLAERLAHAVAVGVAPERTLCLT
ncbi:MAG: UvrD-helicase domain-containing protein, partial [Chloroflexota bacterium]|nr:UvrD-helicase domain-containing protein [Chloroflexota bacterium]